MSTPQTDTLLPDWLPGLIPFPGDWNAFVRALHVVFRRDFIDSKPRFRRCPVWHDRRVDRSDTHCYEEGFWHLVTRDEWVFDPRTRKKEKQRLPDIIRAEHLPWARPTIEHHADPTMLVWDFEEESRRGSAMRTYVWLKELDYVVVMERQPHPRGDIYMLITAFDVTHEGKRRDLTSRYERRRKEAGPA